MKTRSEELFEKFCQTRGLAISKISEGPVKTPDYLVSGKELEFIAEIKQLDTSKEDNAALREFEEKGFIVISGTPGGRVRPKITKAATQLKKITKGKLSGVVVLYNNLPFVLGDHLEPYNIRVGMFGYESIVLTVPKDVASKPRVVDRKFGPNKKITEKTNTTVSGIAVLSDKHNILTVDYYHNPYAVCPIEEGVLENYGIFEYTLSEKSRLFFQQWERIGS